MSRIDATASRLDELVFTFASAINFDAQKAEHIHAARYVFKGDTLDAEWTGFANGSRMDSTKVSVTRKKG